MGARKRHNNILLAVLGFAVVLVVVIVVAFYPVSQEAEGIHGQVEVSEYHVMGQVPGRILEIRVSEGDYVNVGDTLIIIDAPELPAHGQLVPGADSVLQQAKVGLELAEKSYQRFQRLFDEGVVSATMEVQYEAAKRQEFGNINHETVQTARMEGEVSNVYSKVGEQVDMGSPVMTIARMQDLWGTFLVPDEQLDGMEVGKTFTAFVPAFHQDIVMKVCYVGQLSERTFEVKARPVEQHEGLRPGMSLVIK